MALMFGRVCRSLIAKDSISRGLTAARAITSRPLLASIRSYSTEFEGQTLFSAEHDFCTINGTTATIGITHHAQEMLGEIVFVDVEVSTGDTIDTGDSFGVVESVKAASDVITPVSGTIITSNEELEQSPNLVNESAEDKGWLIKLEMSNTDELSTLMTKADYDIFCRQ